MLDEIADVTRQKRSVTQKESVIEGIDLDLLPLASFDAASMAMAAC